MDHYIDYRYVEPLVHLSSTAFSFVALFDGGPGLSSLRFLELPSEFITVYIHYTTTFVAAYIALRSSCDTSLFLLTDVPH